MMKYIRDMKKLEKRIIVWSAIAKLADRIANHATAKSMEYTLKQEELIRDLNFDMPDMTEELRKSENRRNFRIETDL